MKTKIGQRWRLNCPGGNAIAEVISANSRSKMKIFAHLGWCDWDIGYAMDETNPLNKFWTLLPNQCSPQ